MFSRNVFPFLIVKISLQWKQEVLKFGKIRKYMKKELFLKKNHPAKNTLKKIWSRKICRWEPAVLLVSFANAMELFFSSIYRRPNRKNILSRLINIVHNLFLIVFHFPTVMK